VSSAWSPSLSKYNLSTPKRQGCVTSFLRWLLFGSIAVASAVGLSICKLCLQIDSNAISLSRLDSNNPLAF